MIPRLTNLSLTVTVLGVSCLVALACTRGTAEDPPGFPMAIDDDGGPPTPPPTGTDGGGPPIFADVVHAPTPPPPISGGSLMVTRHGTFAVMGDADLDRVFIVDVATASLAHTIALEPGDEPGRLIDDGAGLVHIALRRGGAVVDLDPRTGEVLARRPVCAAPRGIAWRESDDTLIVACAEGDLVFLPAAGGAPTRRVFVDDDLRDVIVTDAKLYVTRFRAAETLVLTTDGAIAQRITLPDSTLLSTHELAPGFDSEMSIASVAWRTVAAPGGGLVMLHQRATNAVLETDPRAGGYGGFDCIRSPSVVGTSATHIGESVGVGPRLRAVLGVDVAMSPDGTQMAVAAPAQSFPRNADITFSSSVDVMVYGPPEDVSATELVDCLPEARTLAVSDGGAAIAVAYGPDGRLFVQTRGPAALGIFDAGGLGLPVQVVLSEDNMFDTGHSLFHASTGGGLACASCHPEGGDDGRAWRFRDIGLRRTQALRGGIAGTAPFHWDGDMTDFTTLAHTIFEGRMAGSPLGANEISAFSEWLDTVPMPARPPATSSAAVDRGRALFEAPEIGCVTCHAGAALTSNLTVNVGTGNPFQVPSLRGVVYRAPYMHDGCAADLRARFTDPACGGGDMHGHTSELTSAQIDDLVAYLRTL